MGAVPRINFARSGDIHLAYQVVGGGPLDLVYIPSAFGHLETYWEEAAVERFLRRLGSFSRLVIYDKRGTGMSDRLPQPPTMEERTDDLLAIMEAVGTERIAVFGMSEGGAIGALFAATHPDLVSHLVIMGSGAYDFATPEQTDEKVHRVESRWGSGEIVATGCPSVAHDERVRAWVGRLQRRSGTPREMAEIVRLNATYDVRAALPAVRAPTLVLHRSGDRLFSVESGRYYAEHIAGAKFVLLEGTDHIPYFEEPERILDLIEEFVTGTLSGPRRRLALSPRDAGPFGLTGRERDVLQLVAEGRTNRQIADVLFVSPHTVSHHLRGIFAKTGTTNRTAAAAAARQLDRA
jgi:pimeloyl-ACP methyl ester carboxylesterase/DNA-binding CsgD family transcriptional regulator